MWEQWSIQAEGRDRAHAGGRVHLTTGRMGLEASCKHCPLTVLQGWPGPLENLYFGLHGDLGFRKQHHTMEIAYLAQERDKINTYKESTALCPQKMKIPALTPGRFFTMRV